MRLVSPKEGIELIFLARVVWIVAQRSYQFVQQIAFGKVN
jgi:hypothetical protein